MAYSKSMKLNVDCPTLENTKLTVQQMNDFTVHATQVFMCFPGADSSIVYADYW